MPSLSVVIAGGVRLPGVIERARARQRRRREALALVAAGIAATATALAAGAGGHARPPGASRAPAAALTRRMAAGRDVAQLSLPEPAGVILVARISAPLGVRASVDARLPGVGGYRAAFGTAADGANPSCADRAGIATCTTAFEWCPLSAGTWHLRLVKFGGPAAAVRVDFEVGRRPAA